MSQNVLLYDMYIHMYICVYVIMCVCVFVYHIQYMA